MPSVATKTQGSQISLKKEPEIISVKGRRGHFGKGHMGLVMYQYLGSML